MTYFAIAFINWLVWVYILRCGKKDSIEASVFWPIVWAIGVVWAIMYVIKIILWCIWAFVSVMLSELGVIDICK